MTKLWTRLRQRKLVQWALAYIAFAFALLQGVDIVAQRFAWPEAVERGLIVALFVGFFAALVLAWYHGERGAQHVTGMEVIVLAVLLCIGGGFLWQFARAPQPPLQSAAAAASVPAGLASITDTEGANSIAVLPFVDMSQTHDQEYFSDGLSDELLNMLAQLPQLRVIARTSSFSFKGRDVDIATIARKLDVSHILEGSVRKSGDTLRISAQLIRASDSSQIWSQTYDRRLTDVFKVQDEIAAAVVDALKVKLLPEQHLSNPYRSSNTEAWNEYLLAKAFYNRDTPADWRKAADGFQRAIELEPGYGAAWVGLADAQYLIADLAGDPSSKQHALDVANQAVARAPSLAEAYAARGVTRSAFFRDWAGAQADFSRALQLDPASADVQLGNYRLSMALGRHQDAVDQARKAIRLDPLNSYAWICLGRAMLVTGDKDGALKAMQRGRDISPDSILAGFGLGTVELVQGRASDALATFRAGQDVYSLAGIAMAEHSLGHRRQSQQAVDEAAAKYGKNGSYQIAEAYAWRGEYDKAFEWLDKALEQGDGGLSFLKSDALMAGLVGDPRYAALLKKMGLPE